MTPVRDLSGARFRGSYRQGEAAVTRRQLHSDGHDFVTLAFPRVCWRHLTLVSLPRRSRLLMMTTTTP